MVEDDALSHKTLAVAADRLHPTAAAAAVVHVSRVKRGGGDWCGRLFADFIATELGPLKPKPPTQLQLLIYSSAKHISLTSAFSSTLFPYLIDLVIDVAIKDVPFGGAVPPL